METVQQLCLHLWVNSDFVFLGETPSCPDILTTANLKLPGPSARGAAHTPFESGCGLPGCSDRWVEIARNMWICVCKLCLIDNLVTWVTSAKQRKLMDLCMMFIHD